MLTLGLAHDLFISSAAVVRDGQVVAAIAEERLNRQKQYKGFPALALQECLRMASAELGDVDKVAVGWNPTRHLDFPQHRFSNNARMRGEYLYAVPNMLLSSDAQLASGEWVEQRMPGLAAPITYIDHQLAHAANAFQLSGYDRAAVFSADGRGERDTCYWGVADETGYRQMGGVYFPHSLGLFYGAITQFLGYKPDSDEWKVMALAAFAEDGGDYYRKLKPLIQVNSDSGVFRVDQTYLGFAVPEAQGGKLFTEDFIELMGPPRERDEEFTARHYQIAHAMQRVFEESMAQILTAVHRQTGEPRLAAAGGCLMNSVYNGKIVDTTPFAECFISSCPDDSGISIGAALWAHQSLVGEVRPIEHRHNYWGPDYDDEIRTTLDKYKLPYRRLEDAPRAAAELLAGGKLIGWYQGAMEFGQRALGNRSILADPRSVATKDKVNAAVKYRESFRPFAPAILADRVNDYFDCPPGERVRFMERVFRFQPAAAEAVPAVVHADGTGRLQTVEADTNPRFHALITEFEALTGVPLVLNTSFNLNGEPIVCTPTDAVRTFFSCGLDALILGNFVVSKSVHADSTRASLPVQERHSVAEKL